MNRLALDWAHLGIFIEPVNEIEVFKGENPDGSSDGMFSYPDQTI